MVGMAELVRKGHKYFVPDFGTELILRRNRDFREGIIQRSWREGLAGRSRFYRDFLLFSFGAVLYKRPIVALSSTILCGRHCANHWDRKRDKISDDTAPLYFVPRNGTESRVRIVLAMVGRCDVIEK